MRELSKREMIEIAILKIQKNEPIPEPIKEALKEYNLWNIFKGDSDG